MTLFMVGGPFLQEHLLDNLRYALGIKSRLHTVETRQWLPCVWLISARVKRVGGRPEGPNHPIWVTGTKLREQYLSRSHQLDYRGQPQYLTFHLLKWIRALAELLIGST